MSKPFFEKKTHVRERGKGVKEWRCEVCGRTYMAIEEGCPHDTYKDPEGKGEVMRECKSCREVLGMNEKHRCTKLLGRGKREGTSRISIDEYMIRFTQLAAIRSTCLRAQHGAILVRDKQIISTGYNGACRRQDHCTGKGRCEREERGALPGEMYELCVAVHAEQNAIIQAARHGVSAKDAILYVTGLPCLLCARMIVNAGIREVHYIASGRYTDESLSIFAKAGVLFIAHKALLTTVLEEKVEKAEKSAGKE